MFIDVLIHNIIYSLYIKQYPKYIFIYVLTIHLIFRIILSSKKKNLNLWPRLKNSIFITAYKISTKKYERKKPTLHSIKMNVHSIFFYMMCANMLKKKKFNKNFPTFYFQNEARTVTAVLKRAVLTYFHLVYDNRYSKGNVSPNNQSLTILCYRFC